MRSDHISWAANCCCIDVVAEVRTGSKIRYDTQVRKKLKSRVMMQLRIMQS